MRRLRLGYPVTSLSPGGAERQMLALAERLPHDRFSVEFIILSGPGIYDDRARAAGARLRYLGVAPPVDAPLPMKLARRFGKVARYVKVARRAAYDIVDAWLYPADVLAALARPITRSPIIIAGRRNVDPQDQFAIVERPVASVVGHLTDVVVANSAAAARHAVTRQRVDPAKIRIIRNGVAPMPPATLSEREEQRRAWGVADDEIVIGCVANYSPVKRHEVLIDAFAGLVATGLRVRLVLVGEGPRRPAMEQQLRALDLESKVCLVGMVPDAGMLFRSFDVAVQASCREGLPNALLEAAAAGRPIVATAAGGSSEIVLDGQTGLLVPIDDRPAMVRALRLAVTDEELRRRLGEAAREHATRAFGMDRFVAEFAALYEELAGSRRLRD